jgi:glycine C-acetyltransferase
MNHKFTQHLSHELEELKKNGLYKEERALISPQGASIELKNHRKLLNFCANNYLGLSNRKEMVEAAKHGLDKYGFGLSSVRFICGTQNIHLELEKKLSTFLGTDDTILYSSCFDANGGLFETLLGPEDAIISDSLNHASIIDGIRLCKAKRLRYENNNMDELEERLIEAKECRFKMIATDGAFSMDGSLANLPKICDLAEKQGALVMVDDCHATGFMGANGKGTHEHFNVMKRVDILTGTLGKAIGGASGGYISGRKEIVEWLRQRSRPYLFSNTLCPSIVTASLAVFELLEKEGPILRKRLFDNAVFFREEMTKLGFKLLGEGHPIIPVLLEDAKCCQEFAKQMIEEGIFVFGFFYPVVPQGKARIRTQMSAVHTKEDLIRAIEAFEKVGKKLNII